MDGAVLSILIVTEFEAVPPPLVAVHVRVVPAVSDVSVVDEHPLVEVMVDCASVTIHDTVTSLTYQPFVPRVPEIEGVITGGVESPVTVNVAVATTLPPPHPGLLQTLTVQVPAGVAPDVANESVK